MFSYDSLLRHRSAVRSLHDDVEPQLDLSTLFGNVSAREIIANVTYYTELLKNRTSALDVIIPAAADDVSGGVVVIRSEHDTPII